MKRRRLVLILLLLAAGGGGAWYWYSGRMNATNNIQVSGNLELTQVDLSFKTAGRMTELAVREGQFVKKGDLIAKLDSAQLEQQLLRDQAAVASAASVLLVPSRLTRRGGAVAAVVSHGLAKERVVPPKEIDRAVERKKRFEANPAKHTYEEA